MSYLKELHARRDTAGEPYLDRLHVKREALRETAAEDVKNGIRRRGSVICPGLEVEKWPSFDSRNDECPRGTARAFGELMRNATSEERTAAVNDFVRKFGAAVGAVLAISLPFGCTKDGNLVAPLSDVADATVLADGEADDLSKNSTIQDYIKP